SGDPGVGYLGGGEIPRRDSERWLDLCAGPGGKARLLAGLAASSGARLAAAELHEHRARLIRSASAAPPAPAGPRGRSAGRDGRPGPGRGGLAWIVADGPGPAWRPGAFDRVIADVPCSGLGSLRRRPEARWRRSPQAVTGLGGLQRDLLAAALDAARPGGLV